MAQPVTRGEYKVLLVEDDAAVAQMYKLKLELEVTPSWLHQTGRPDFTSPRSSNRT